MSGIAIRTKAPKTTAMSIHAWNSHGNVRAYFSRGIPGETTSRITTAARCRLLRTRVWAEGWFFRVLADLAKALNAQDLANRVWRQCLETLETDEGDMSCEGALRDK
jgi:hypothetical protein